MPTGQAIETLEEAQGRHLTQPEIIEVAVAIAKGVQVPEQLTTHLLLCRDCRNSVDEAI